jgi:hypothetical protein
VGHIVVAHGSAMQSPVVGTQTAVVADAVAGVRIADLVHAAGDVVASDPTITEMRFLTG